MKPYKILSPSGEFHNVLATSEYHAVELVCKIDNYKYSNADYFDMNNIKKLTINPPKTSMKVRVCLN
jgi:hypothetical protein